MKMCSDAATIEILRVGDDPFGRTNDDGTPIRTVFYRDKTISETATFYCWLSHWSKDWPQPPNNNYPT